jgi:hypothetical protein
MSQNGRREFLTSAAAVAAALAACTAPARRAQAQHCGSIYDEQGIVPKVGRFVSDSTFRNQLITFPATITPTMANLTNNLVDNTFNALNDKHLTSVTVKSPPNPSLPSGLPSGTYNLIPSGTTPGPGNRWPVVLSVQQQQAGSFNPDWSKVLLFVIPDPKDPGGHDITTEAQAHSAVCIHPFGM